MTQQSKEEHGGVIDHHTTINRNYLGCADVFSADADVIRFIGPWMRDAIEVF